VVLDYAADVARDLSRQRHVQNHDRFA
jgi:hypothetical protein